MRNEFDLQQLNLEEENAEFAAYCRKEQKLYIIIMIISNPGDAYSSGKGQTVLTSPDSIANWSLASSFWGPGHHSVCRPAPSTVISKKDFYMTVELPKHIYMNETITAEIIVTTEVPLSEYLDLSVCISGLAYQACIDQGPRGELGQEIYNQVRLTKSTSSGVRKTPIFFTRPGKVDLVFTLRRQYNITFHHCKEGKIEDMVKVTVNVEKRADTELSYKGIIISPDKPLKEETKTRSTERIDYDQIRNGKQVTTNIHINLMESEAQALALEISKFLPTAPFNVPKAFRDEKRKLGVLPTKKLFLSDILREFSVKLYKLKAIELNPKKSLTEIEESMDLKGEIVQLVSAMSTFTNCTSDGSHCGYGEYGTPQRDNDISIPLTAVSSMLLCQWGADSSMTRGPVQLLFRSVRGVIDEDREVDDILQDLPRATDRIALLQALLYQVGVDCKGVFDEAHDNPRRNKELIINQKELTRRLFFIDNLGRLDPRVIASLGSMSLLVIHDQARLMLNRSIRRNQIPFWEFNETCQAGPCEENLPNDVKQFIRFQDEKRNAVLLNSLGLLAYAEKGIINKSGGNTNLDHLADWIFEQKRDDEAYFGVLDTFFASRALYVYRKNHNSSAFSGDTKLNIRYMHDDKLVDDEVILDDNALLVPLPANVSALNIVSSGDGKVKLGVQLVTSKRQRSKRNTPDDFFPVKITCNQQTIGDSNLIQEVCIQVKSRFLKTLQIDHALYTGFKSSPAQFQLKTKSGARIIGEVEFSDYGAHAIFTNVSWDFLGTKIIYERYYWFRHEWGGFIELP
uniref:A2M domain-containing protein n=1 Tax=Steinernema glaseri TaxID=37863 RepID=A0A1I7XVS2_9BILA